MKGERERDASFFVKLLAKAFRWKGQEGNDAAYLQNSELSTIRGTSEITQKIFNDVFFFL